MNKKYVIKDCISYEDGLCVIQDMYCQDCTYCNLKQIVELCKGSIRENERDIYRAGRMSLAINILGFLDIQEVE